MIGRDLLAAALLAGALPAQYLETFSVHTAAPEGFFGQSVCIPGDFDGDGNDDVVASHHSIDTVKVYSGQGGRFLFELNGASGDDFGWSVASAGDVDADGVGDLVIGAPQFVGGGSGYVVVVSGRTRSRLRTIVAPVGQQAFGEHVAAAGDFNNDGFDDVVVSTFDGARQGSVYVYSGRDGRELQRETLPSKIFCVAGLGDLDGDGFAEIGIGVENGFDTEIVSGRTRGTLATYFQPSGITNFGQSLASGDVDGDGDLEVIIGAGASAGTVFVYDHPTRSQLMRIDGTGNDQLGTVVRAADIDGDGRADVVAGAPNINPSLSAGYVLVVGHDGTPNGRTIGLLPGKFGGEQFGVDVGLGDVNDDGKPDLVVGVPRASEITPLGGRITTFENVTPADPGNMTRFGKGCDGSLGRRMRLEVGGRPILGANFSLRVRAAPVGALGVVSLGLARAATPLQGIGMPGCTDLVSELMAVAVRTDSSGRGQLGLAVPANSALVGLDLQSQWFVVDPPANSLGVVASGGLEVTIGAG